MITQTELKIEFDRKVKETLSFVEDIETFKNKDKYIKYVFEIADWLINKNLDEADESTLLRIGGKLSGIYAYLGNWSARARTERDVYEQQLGEELNRLTTELYGEAEGKITLSRARAKQEVSELEKLVIIKENEKNNYENLMNAIQSMISLIQSFLKIKTNERFISSRLQDQN
jgi:hypothetical protein